MYSNRPDPLGCGVDHCHLEVLPFRILQGQGEALLGLGLHRPADPLHPSGSRHAKRDGSPAPRPAAGCAANGERPGDGAPGKITHRAGHCTAPHSVLARPSTGMAARPLSLPRPRMPRRTRKSARCLAGKPGHSFLPRMLCASILSSLRPTKKNAPFPHSSFPTAQAVYSAPQRERYPPLLRIIMSRPYLLDQRRALSNEGGRLCARYVEALPISVEPLRQWEQGVSQDVPCPVSIVSL